MAETTVNKALNKIKKCGRGSVFFPGDFVAYGSSKAVNKVLERLTNEGTLSRVAHGIYCYPKIEKHYGLGAVPATQDEIAQAIAKRSGAHIIPTGEWAQYQLGLTQQVPMNYVYLTDGASRKITLPNNQTIVFKHASPKYFTIYDSLGALLVTALKDWKIDNLSDEQKQTIQTQIQEHGPFSTDILKRMPIALRDMIRHFVPIGKPTTPV